jgi:general secretion pathway protein K
MPTRTGSSRRASPVPERERERAGFALIIVLWTLVLIAFIVAALLGTSRTELRIAGNLTTNAVVAAAADGAVSHAIFALLAPDPKQRWPLDGGEHDFKVGDCDVSVNVYDDAARINPNVASPAMLEALLRITGSDPATARRLAAAIGAWVGSSGVARPPNALLAEYREAGRDYAPPGQPFETIGELRDVLGMTPSIFAAIRPHLSLFTGAEPNAAHADSVVTAVLAALGKGRAGATPPPPDAANFTARITAIARGPNSAQAQRSAVVRFDAGSQSYQVLAWRREPE